MSRATLTVDLGHLPGRLRQQGVGWERNNAARSQRLKVAEMLEKRVRVNDQMDSNEIVPASKWQHGWSGKSREDPGKPFDPVWPKMKHQVSVLASRQRGLQPYLQVVQRRPRHHKLSFASRDLRENAHAVLSEAGAGLSQVGNRVGETSSTNTLECATHRHYLNIDALNLEPSRYSTRQMCRNGASSEVGDAGRAIVLSARYDEVAASESKPDSMELFELLLKHDVRRDERCVETTSSEPRSCVTGAHLDEVDLINRCGGSGAPEGRRREARVVEQHEDGVPKPAL